MLKRKVDLFLENWKHNPDKKPLIVSGARQIGKTTSIEKFGKTYKSFIEINFVTMPQYCGVFKNGYEVNEVIKEISLINPSFLFIPADTLILFDEIQECPDAVTSLKPFAIDRRFDVICSGSLLGVNYKKISSVPVGFKEEYPMYSLDFEEYLWAIGYSEEQIDEIYSFMKNLEPIPDAVHEKLKKHFRDYVFVGGMPEAVQTFMDSGVFGPAFAVGKRILKDYEDDITKYVEGLDMAKVKNVYRHISSQLAKDNHKYQLTKLGHGARYRDYAGCEDWLKDAGVVNIAYNLSSLALPLSGNELPEYFRMYYADHSLFIASLDDEAKEDLVVNGNYDIYNGSLYESIISEALIKEGYNLYFYRNEDSTVELDFVIRVKNEIVPVEVKRNRGRSRSLNSVIENGMAGHGVKLTGGNIGYSDNKFTFPYYLAFLLKRFLKDTDYISWKNNEE